MKEGEFEFEQNHTHICIVTHWQLWQIVFGGQVKAVGHLNTRFACDLFAIVVCSLCSESAANIAYNTKVSEAMLTCLPEFITYYVITFSIYAFLVTIYIYIYISIYF